ncbi:glycoside hydrolase family 2 TIM barrel-domain containing protein [Cohnella sp. GCM10027633]|uniref:glycoside hydrolase family 2 TIM barrel-domain containing protein n=1 Tax=unclassified Cohnella TaxID=2636738 RepID=UPI003628F932
MNNLHEWKEPEPLVVTEDGAVVSRLRFSRPEGYAIVVKANNVTIQECDIAGAIVLYGPVSGIKIRNNYIHDLKPSGTLAYVKQFAGVMTTEGDRWDNPIVQPMGASDIEIRGNYFENCPTGAYLVECKGPITFSGNFSKNHRGPFPRGQMVQVALCDGREAPILIENNFSYVDPESPDQCQREHTGFGAEDHINGYCSTGSEEYPIVVRDNYIYGYSSSSCGSGIMLGDGGGGYYHVLGNKVYRTGNAGIGLSGGHHWLVRGNRIHQDPPASQYNGKGLQIDNYGDTFATPIVVEDNVVYWQCGKGDGSLLCMIDKLVTFKNNVFGDKAAFGEADPMPPQQPPGAVEGLLKPWERNPARRRRCLNGEWRFAPIYEGDEPGDTIRVEAWEETPIRVPSSWRFLLRNMPDEAQTYRPYDLFGYPEEWNRAEAGVIGRQVRVDRAPNERVWLLFNGIMQASKIYIDDKLVHSSDEAFLPIRIDVTDWIGEGRTSVDVKVWCGPFRTIAAGAASKRIAPDGTWFAGMARGIWQDVFLEYTPELHLGDCRIVTSWRTHTIGVEAELFNRAAEGADITLRAFVYDGTLRVKELAVTKAALAGGGSGSLRTEAEWTDPNYWSPDNPHLYALRLEVYHNGQVVDAVDTRFGFREVWAEGHKFYLNGVRVNLRSDAWHYQGFAQQTKAYALNWYRLAKESGINFIRLHGMPYPELYLEAADEVGMLLIGESAIYGSAKSIQADDPAFIDQSHRHLESIMRRDRNHPSVVMWSMQNEMRWVDGRDGYKRHIRELMETINRLDGTRLISCDGDNRLLDPADMQVVSMHYNIDGTVDGWDRRLPLIFGEHGKWHYIAPQVASDYVGQSAYLSFEEAQRNLGLSEKMFVEYARKAEVTGVSPFNMVNYMMKTMPEQDVALVWDDLETPGVKPRTIVKNSITLDNGWIGESKPYMPNSAYTEFRDSFKPATIIADDYNGSFYAGEDVARSFTVYNDTLVPHQAKIVFEVKGEIGTIAAGQFDFLQQPGEQEAIAIRFVLPEPEEGRVAIVGLEMRLYHEGIEQYVLTREYKAYSRARLARPVDMRGKRVAYVGSDEGLAIVSGLVDRVERIDEVNEASLDGADIVVIGPLFSGKADYLQPPLEGFANAGGVVIVLEQRTLAFGEVELSGRKYFKTFMNDHNHPIFAGLEEDDLAFWDRRNANDPACGHLVGNAFNKPAKGDFRILLECAEGDFGWGGLMWTPLLEYANGRGTVIMSQLELTAYSREVPQACALLRNILAYAASVGGRTAARTVLYGEPLSEFAAYFAGLGLLSDSMQGSDTESVDADIVLADPSGLRTEDASKLVSYMENGGTLVLPGVLPEHETMLGRLAGRRVSVEREAVYQLKPSANRLLAGVSAYDLYRMEAVTYSGVTNDSVRNTVIAECSVACVDGESLLDGVNNPWQAFFVEGLDAEAIKMSIATMSDSRPFQSRSYGLLLQVGKGKLLIPQVKLLSDDKTVRFYSRLLANLGAGIRSDVLTQIKADRDYGVGMMMAKKYDGGSRFDELSAYFRDRDYRLNHLGEGPYGYFQKQEKKDGFIRLQNDADDAYFLTLFVESALNRNPLNREDGLLPDTSIVPDLFVTVNCSFEMWMNGDKYIDYKHEGSDAADVKINDVLLNRGVNNWFMVCYGAHGREIAVSARFLNKYGDPVDGLHYRLSLD